jgi:glycosyltransferase involved in cell wall biosynthesis
MRIVYLNPVGKVGGAERGLLHMLAGLRRAAPELDLTMLALSDGSLPAEAEALGVRGVVLPMPAALARLGDSQMRWASRWQSLCALAGHGMQAVPAAWDFLRRLRQQLQALAPDLIHTNGIKAHLLANLARPRGVPVAWHVQDFLSLRPLAARALRRARRGLAGVIAISQAVANDVARVVPGVKVGVILHAIDVDHFCPAPADGAFLDQLAGLPPPPPGTVRVGLVATYARWKGHDTFLQAANLLTAASEPLPVRFYIIGGPIYLTSAQYTLEELQARSASLGLSGRVGFVPFQSDPALAYRALDIMVHASTQPEPFGLTIVEAMACGRAVVVANAGGAAELFHTGEDAMGVEPGNAPELAQTIAKLMRDPELRRRLGSAARDTAVRRFDRRRLGAEALDFYQKVLPGPKPGRRTMATLGQ